MNLTPLTFNLTTTFGHTSTHLNKVNHPKKSQTQTTLQSRSTNTPIRSHRLTKVNKKVKHPQKSLTQTTLQSHSTNNPILKKVNQKVNHPQKSQTKILQFHSNNTTRKSFLLSFLSIPILHTKSAKADNNSSSILDFFRMTVPDQTVEEAENGIREHAKELLQVKEMLELESWKEAQKELRKSSSYLKQDIYTIIQGKPGMERAQLRNLYSNLFNSVTRLDYAARDKDLPRVWKFYGDIVVALNDILSRI